MAGKLTISFMLAFIGWLALPTAGQTDAVTLRDGFFLNGVDGRLIYSDSNRWSFEFIDDINDGRNFLKPGWTVEFLPSSALEKTISDANNQTDKNYRLWGRLTKYNNENYIFCIHALPLEQIRKNQPKQSADARQPKTIPAVNDRNDAVTIPDEILKKLNNRRIVRPVELKKGLEIKLDFILSEKTGFIKEKKTGQYIFTPDTIGRNVQNIQLPLLPCGTLQRALQKQSSEPEQLRFKVTGIVTEYAGKHYLLLQRAIRVYSYGNF